MLAPAYFSPNCKYFDQLLQTVKNKTTVLILVFKDLLQISIPPLISLIYAKEYHNFPLKKLSSHSAEKFPRGTLECVTDFGYRKFLCIREGVTTFLRRNFLSHSAEKFRRGTF